MIELKKDAGPLIHENGLIIGIRPIATIELFTPLSYMYDMCTHKCVCVCKFCSHSKAVTIPSQSSLVNIQDNCDGFRHSSHAYLVRGILFDLYEQWKHYGFI